jgi:hypothetical protein
VIRFIIWDNSPEYWTAAAIVLAMVVGIAVYHWLRPPAWKKLIEDDRYREALNIYAGHLQHEEPTDDDRRQALAAGVEHLTKECGILAEEAEAKLRLVAAQYDRERSNELRKEGSLHEQAGAYDVALDYYERAAWWQEEHDPKDYQFLQQCVARVRKKVRSG